MPTVPHSDSITVQVIKTLDRLPVQAQRLVLAYAQSLDLQHKQSFSPDNPYPLRGTASFDLDPAEPALAAEDWDAVRGIVIRDSD